MTRNASYQLRKLMHFLSYCTLINKFCVKPFHQYLSLPNLYSFKMHDYSTLQCNIKKVLRKSAFSRWEFDFGSMAAEVCLEVKFRYDLYFQQCWTHSDRKFRHTSSMYILLILPCSCILHGWLNMSNPCYPCILYLVEYVQILFPLYPVTGEYAPPLLPLYPIPGLICLEFVPPVSCTWLNVQSLFLLYPVPGWIFQSLFPLYPVPGWKCPVLVPLVSCTWLNMSTFSSPCSPCILYLVENVQSLLPPIDEVKKQAKCDRTGIFDYERVRWLTYGKAMKILHSFYCYWIIKDAVW